MPLPTLYPTSPIKIRVKRKVHANKKTRLPKDENRVLGLFEL